MMPAAHVATSDHRHASAFSRRRVAAERRTLGTPRSRQMWTFSGVSSATPADERELRGPGDKTRTGAVMVAPPFGHHC